MPAVPWLIEGPRSTQVFVTSPDAAPSAISAAAARLDDALSGFASPPPAWFLLLERFDRWWYAVGVAVATAVAAPLMGDFGRGLAVGIAVGLVLAAVSRVLLEALAKSLARAKAGESAEDAIESLKPVVRVASGGLDWADAIIAAEPSTADEVHSLLWRVTDLPDADGQTAANELFKRWKRIDPEAAGAIEAEEAAEQARLDEEEREGRL